MSAVAVQSIPAVCTVEQLCDLLHVSQRTFYEQRAAGTFPIPEIEPRIGRRPRFAGEQVRRYLAGEFQPARRSR